MNTTISIGFEHHLPISDPQALIEKTLPVPVLAPHDLLVDVAAVSVNPIDTKQRFAGQVDGFRVLGFDAAGTVTKVGRDVTLFAPGDQVFYAGAVNRNGTNQRLHVVDERLVGKKPSTLSFSEAAALPLTSITAWEVLFDRLRLTGDSQGTLLVIGATGGVGSIMLQLAEVLLPHLTVIATASDEERARWVKGLGAEHTVNHHEALVAQVLNLAPGGVDWLFTAHSEGQIASYAQMVRPFGHIVAIDGGPRDIAVLKDKSIAWHWEFMFTRAVQQTADMVEQHHALNRVADLVDQGRIRTTLTKTLSPINVDTLREAHRIIEDGHMVGKLVIEGWEQN